MARRISVTMLSSYLYCSRKLFLEKVLGLFEPEKLELVKGSIRHDTYDNVNKIEEGIVKSIISADSFEDIYSRYAKSYSSILRRSIVANKFRLRNVKLPLIDAYHQIWPFFQRESEIRALNIFKFIEKFQVYGNELWEKLTPKIESEYRIDSENLLLTGIIDQVEKHPEGFVPIELKTGKMPADGVWPGHRVQIAAYALMLEEKLGKEVKEGFVYYLDSDTRRQIIINPFLKEEVKELRKKVCELLESKEIPAITDNENKCSKCGLKEKCFDEKFLEKLLKSKQQEKA